MNYRLVVAVLSFAICSISAIAFAAAGEPQQAWWHVLVAELIKVVVLIFTPVLGTLAFVMMRKWGLKVELDKVQSVAAMGVGFAEQKALSALRDGKDKTSGAEKMKTAMDFANGLAASYKLPKRATDSLSGLIEAKLGEHKLISEAPKTE